MIYFMKPFTCFVQMTTMINVHNKNDNNDPMLKSRNTNNSN